MATCSVQDLMDDAPCFADLAGPGQWEAVKLTLLCKILQALDPMASCTVQDLLDEAECFFPVAIGAQAKTLELQLMCNIFDALGSGAALLGITSGAGNPPVDGSITTLMYKDTLTNVKYVNTGTIAVPAWEAL